MFILFHVLGVLTWHAISEKGESFSLVVFKLSRYQGFLEMLWTDRPSKQVHFNQSSSAFVLYIWVVNTVCLEKVSLFFKKIFE